MLNRIAQLQREKEELRGIISASAFSDGSSSILAKGGAEQELFLVDATGNWCGVADDVVETLRDPHYTNEFFSASVEIDSDPIPINHEFFPALYRELVLRTRTVAAAAREYRAVPLGMGTLPTFPIDALGRTDLPSAKRRYQQFLEVLTARHGSYQFELNGRRIHVPCSPTAAGITCGFSPNVGVRPDLFGLALNIATATAWTSPLLSSTSPFALGGVGAWNSRPILWHYGMDPAGKLSPFGIGSYYRARGVEALIEWSDFLENGERILEFQDTPIDAGAPFAATRLQTGTTWVQTCRPRFTTSGRHASCYIELRLPDTALTIADNVADFAFFVGLLGYYLPRLESASELCSYEEAMRAYLAARLSGDPQLIWRGSAVTASQLILRELLVHAADGLECSGIPAKTAAHLLNMIERRLAVQSAPDWMRRTVAETALPLHNALRSMVVETAKRQAVQPDELADTSGVADWK